MSTLFISDLHLDESRPNVTRALLQFLRQQAANADALYILGDFFEVWVGDDNHTPLIQQIVESLATLTCQGTAVYLMHGNRDFLLGPQFCQQTGCQLIADPCVVNLYGHSILLMHGDSLCTQDSEYLKFRAQVRDPQWQQALLAKPLPERIAIGRQLREASEQANSNKAEEIMDVTPAEVLKSMRYHHVDLLIHGHTHRPAIHTMDQVHTRIVLGDWHQRGWYLSFHANGKYDLIDFAIAP